MVCSYHKLGEIIHVQENFVNDKIADAHVTYLPGIGETSEPRLSIGNAQERRWLQSS
jgi:hypothetical protein